MRVRELMTHDVWSCEPEDDLSSIGRIMARVGCGAIPVRTADGRLTGFLTDRDVCIWLAERDRRPSEVTAGEVMRRQVWSCRAGDDVGDALLVMARHRVRRLPVVDEHEKLVGILSLDDVAAAAKALVAAPHDGPIYADVARTLRAVSHAQAHGKPLA